MAKLQSINGIEYTFSKQIKSAYSEDLRWLHRVSQTTLVDNFQQKHTGFFFFLNKSFI